MVSLFFSAMWVWLKIGPPRQPGKQSTTTWRLSSLLVWLENDELTRSPEMIGGNHPMIKVLWPKCFIKNIYIIYYIYPKDSQSMSIESTVNSYRWLDQFDQIVAVPGQRAFLFVSWSFRCFNGNMDHMVFLSTEQISFCKLYTYWCNFWNTFDAYYMYIHPAWSFMYVCINNSHN